jgi:ribonuclease HI
MLFSFKRETALLPNDDVLPTADAFTECFEENLLPNGALLPNSVKKSVSFLYQFSVLTAVRLHFPASNNMEEYEALLCGLRITIETGIKRLDIRGDSQLVIDKVMKNVSCHDDKMEAYCNVVRALEDRFYGIELNHVPRRYNVEADELAKIASG